MSKIIMRPIKVNKINLIVEDGIPAFPRLRFLASLLFMVEQGHVHLYTVNLSKPLRGKARISLKHKSNASYLFSYFK
jgi:hypothetical protein